MSEKLTEIWLPGAKGGGIGEWGEQDAATMVAQLRQHADHLRRQVAEIDAAADSDFRIVCARGVHVRRDPKVIQEGRGK